MTTAAAAASAELLINYLPHDNEDGNGDDPHVGTVWIKPSYMCPAAQYINQSPLSTYLN